MAKINRTDVIQKAVSDLAFSQSGEKIPNETLDKVQLTYDINPIVSNRVVNANVTVSSASGTFVAADTTTRRDLYITSASIGVIKDATCDAASTQIIISAAVNGSTKVICALPLLTLTAQNNIVTISFPVPIKVDRGGIINRTTPAFTVGNMISTYVISYYESSSN